MTTLSKQNPPLEWTGTPLRELLRLSWPIAVSMLSYSVMTLADTLFVSRLGAAPLAGVGLGGTAAFTLLCFSFGLLFGVKVKVSQSVGAALGTMEQRALLGAGLWLALGCGLAMLALGRLLTPWVASISAGEEATGFTATYFGIRMLGAPLVFAHVALREARYGVGETRTPMAAALAGNAVNILLDYVFIFSLELGVAGAAWATLTAHGVEFAVLAVAQVRRGFGLGDCRWRHLRAVVRVGLPTGVQFVLEVGSFMMLAALIAALSEVEMAAHQIALQVIHFSFLPAYAVSEAASVMTGQAVGAERDDLVRPVARIALWVSGLYMSACAVVLVAASEAIVACFDAPGPVAQAAVHLLWVAAGFQLADAANMVARGALRGTGDVRVPAVIGIVTAWVLTPPLTWLLGYRAGLGALGGWLGLLAELIVGAAILWWRLERGGWQAAAHRSRAELEATEASAPSAQAQACVTSPD